MKVAVFSYARTGSTVLHEYIKKSLNHKGAAPPFTNEVFNKNFLKQAWKEENIVVKFMFDFLPLVDEIKRYFDKVIFLSRLDDLKCAESFAQAKISGVWYKPYEYEKISKKDFIEYLALIKQQRIKVESLGGFQITYEELYFTSNGLKRLNEYLGIKTTEFIHLLDSRHKLRQND